MKYYQNDLNPEAIKEFSHEKLEDYTLYLEWLLGNGAVYMARVRAEWDRRERAGYYEQT